MSPEQAKGREADKRTDIWAFGAVLYEMLAGHRAFAGEHTSDILAAVVSQDVDWAALHASTPPAVRRLIARCLDRDVKQRLRDIGEARIALDARVIADAETGISPGAFDRPRNRWMTARRLMAGLAGILLAGLASAAAWYLKPAPTGIVTRFAITLPDGQAFSRGIGRHSVAISPDGAQIVYSGVPAGLYLRAMGRRAREGHSRH